MNPILILIIAALVFAVCFLVDRAFTKLFRSKAQHRSGKAVRASKRYGLFGVVFFILGIVAISNGVSQGKLLFVGGFIVLFLGIVMAVYYLSFGIFYDDDTFLVSSFGKRSVEYRYSDIEKQQLYVVSGGSVIVELWLKNGKTLSLQSGMEGVYPFLDHAFAAWCRQTARLPEDCAFHDPAKSWWFPHEEDA